jgi:hypothetical protein
MGGMAKVVMRTARTGIRATPQQRRRCYGLLRAGADVWSALVEMNH